MALKDDILAAIQACADGSGDADLRVSLGSPGDKILLRGEVVETGQAYEQPGFTDCLIEGIANAIEAQGSGLKVQQDDTDVASDVSTLNFEGTVSVVDDGSGKVTITIS